MIRGNARSRIAALLLSGCFVAQAQTPHPPAAGGPPAAPRGVPQGPIGEGPIGERGRRGPPPPSTAELARALSLDETRAKALEAILQRHRERMQALHRTTREGHDAIARDTDAELRKLLDAKQLERFHAWRAEHRPPPDGPRGRHGPGRHRPPPPGARPPHDGGSDDGRPAGKEG